MFRFLLVSLLVFSNNSGFSSTFKDDPNEKFDGTQRFTDQSLIKWVVSDNVIKDCEKESRRRGFGGFGYKLQACSFWDQSSTSQCLIITSKKVNMHSLGHELRHCFQGNYHE